MPQLREFSFEMQFEKYADQLLHWVKANPEQGAVSIASNHFLQWIFPLTRSFLMTFFTCSSFLVDLSR
jgi:hypothetical protein